MKRGQLLSIDDGRPTKRQHTKPCPDCPWSRESLPGWLGGLAPREWILIAHGDGVIECHTTDKQCAGAAIYRANVCKHPRDPSALSLKPNRVTVFASPAEFTAHHRGKS